MEISFENVGSLEEHGVDINTVIRKLLPLCGKPVLVEQITREKVDYIQGYDYSKHLPMQEFLKFIEGENVK